MGRAVAGCRDPVPQPAQREALAARARDDLAPGQCETRHGLPQHHVRHCPIAGHRARRRRRGPCLQAQDGARSRGALSCQRHTAPLYGPVQGLPARLHWLQHAAARGVAGPGPRHADPALHPGSHDVRSRPLCPSPRAGRRKHSTLNRRQPAQRVPGTGHRRACAQRGADPRPARHGEVDHHLPPHPVANAGGCQGHRHVLAQRGGRLHHAKTPRLGGARRLLHPGCLVLLPVLGVDIRQA